MKERGEAKKKIERQRKKDWRCYCQSFKFKLKLKKGIKK